MSIASKPPTGARAPEILVLNILGAFVQATFVGPKFFFDNKLSVPNFFGTKTTTTIIAATTTTLMGFDTIEINLVNVLLMLCVIGRNP